MSLAIQYCFFCGLPIVKSKGRKPDSMITHHISYKPEVKEKAHAYCHRYYHTMLYQYRKNTPYLLRAIKSEKIRTRFLNRLHTGRGDGYIPYDQRKHYPPPFDVILLFRDLDKYAKEDLQRRMELRHTFEKSAIEMAKTLGLGPQSLEKDFKDMIKLVKRHNGILNTKHDFRRASEVRGQIMANYRQKKSATKNGDIPIIPIVVM